MPRWIPSTAPSPIWMSPSITIVPRIVPSAIPTSVIRSVPWIIPWVVPAIIATPVGRTPIRTVEHRVPIAVKTVESTHATRISIVVIFVVIALGARIDDYGRVEIGFAISAIALAKLKNVVAKRVGTYLLIVTLELATTVILVNVTVLPQ